MDLMLPDDDFGDVVSHQSTVNWDITFALEQSSPVQLSFSVSLQQGTIAQLQIVLIENF